MPLKWVYLFALALDDGSGTAIEAIAAHDDAVRPRGDLLVGS